MAMEHHEEFEYHSRSIARLMSLRPESHNLLHEVVEEVTMACARLDVLLAKRRRELRRKGREVAAGLMVAVGALLMPETLGMLKPALAATAGTKTLWDGIAWLREFARADELLSDESYWLIWNCSRKARPPDMI